MQAKKSLIRDNWFGRCWLEAVNFFHWAVFLYLMIIQCCLHRQFTRSFLLELSPLRLRFQLLTCYHLTAMKDCWRVSWPAADHMPLLIHQSSSYNWNGGGEALVCLQGGKARHHRNPLWLFLSLSSLAHYLRCWSRSYLLSKLLKAANSAWSFTSLWRSLIHLAGQRFDFQVLPILSLEELCYCLRKAQ